MVIMTAAVRGPRAFRNSSRSTPPSAADDTLIVRKPAMDAVAGFVPCAESGTRTSLRWESPRASWYAFVDLARKITFATAMTGNVARTTRPSSRLIASSATVIPTNVTTLINAVVSPVCRNVENASMSVVIRVMIRPDISRS